MKRYAIKDISGNLKAPAEVALVPESHNGITLSRESYYRCSDADALLAQFAEACRAALKRLESECLDCGGGSPEPVSEQQLMDPQYANDVCDGRHPAPFCHPTKCWLGRASYRTSPKGSPPTPAGQGKENTSTLCPRCNQRSVATLAHDPGDGTTTTTRAKWCHECLASPTPPGLSAEQVDAIKVRFEKASPGPWKVMGNTVYVMDDQWFALLGNIPTAEFIAHAITDVPLLIQEVRRLTSENAALRAQHEAAVVDAAEWEQAGNEMAARWNREKLRADALTAQHAGDAAEIERLKAEAALWEGRAREMLAAGQTLSEGVDELTALRAARDKLQAFKDWVHTYLDNRGVPKEFPDGPHSKEGCRIGDRMDFFANEGAELAKQVIELRTASKADRRVMRELAERFHHCHRYAERSLVKTFEQCDWPICKAAAAALGGGE